MSETHVERLVRELSRPQAYAGAAGEVSLVRTHISLLFFAGERVYKVKKPVDLGFLDYTSVERRKHFCEEEVRLNRRMASRTYVGVVPIVERDGGHLFVGGEGETVDWAVEMVRLPAHRMLDAMLERGEIDNAMLGDVVELLVRFHAEAATGEGVDEHGSADAMRGNAEENFEQMRDSDALTATQRAFLRERALAFLDENAELLARRLREGRVREGHGDLHAGNLCFTRDGVVAYDCIEFNRRFRCCDVANELAFLAMDLDLRGYPGFAGGLVRRYASAAHDPEILALIDFYKGYRAIVRGKVATFTAADPALDDAQRARLRADAMRHVQLAASYELRPALVLLCGLPACGKTWLAPTFARVLRAAPLSSDVRRKVLAARSPTASARADFGEGLYSADRKIRTYRSLLAGALRSLRAGHSVVVDATFSQRAVRAPFVAAAARLGLACVVVHVTASEAVTLERLAARERDARSPSDAGADVWRRVSATFEPPDELPAGALVPIPSGEGAAEDASARLVDALIRLAAGPARA